MQVLRRPFEPAAVTVEVGTGPNLSGLATSIPT